MSKADEYADLEGDNKNLRKDVHELEDKLAECEKERDVAVGTRAGDVAQIRQERDDLREKFAITEAQRDRLRELQRDAQFAIPNMIRDAVATAEARAAALEGALRDVPDPIDEARCPEPGCEPVLTNDRSKGYLRCYFLHSEKCYFGVIQRLLDAALQSHPVQAGEKERG